MEFVVLWVAFVLAVVLVTCTNVITWVASLGLLCPLAIMIVAPPLYFLGVGLIVWAGQEET